MYIYYQAREYTKDIVCPHWARCISAKQFYMLHCGLVAIKLQIMLFIVELSSPFASLSHIAPSLLYLSFTTTIEALSSETINMHITSVEKL